MRDGMPRRALILADHIGVQDCLNLIRFALLPSDDLTLAEILRGPFCGLVDDDKYLFPLAYGRAKGQSLWARLQADKDKRFQPANDFLRTVLDRSGWPPFEFLTSVLESEQPNGKTGWQMINARLGMPSRDPIEALLSRALRHDAMGPTSLQGFLSEMESDASEIKRDLAAPDGEIRVMTVHGAKGLQAPIVILPDTTSKPRVRAGPVFQLDGSAVWSPRKETDTRDIEAARERAETKALREHKRLLYVALTRAQDRLIICGAWFGKKPSASKSPQCGYHADSWYAQCAEAMQGLDPVMEDEASQICAYGKPAPCVKRAGDEHAPGPGEIPDWALRPPPDASDTALRQIAPSMLMRSIVPVHAPFGEGREAGMRRGRIIHELLQYLPELDPVSRRKKGEDWLKGHKDLSESARSEMLEAAMRVLEGPDFSTLFIPGGRAEAPVIGSAPELPGGTPINGRIDRPLMSVPPPDASDTALRQIAPSMLMRSIVPVHAPFGEGREAGMRRGRIIHELLQYLPELDPVSRRKKGEDWLKGHKDLSESARSEMLEAAMRVLEGPDFSTLFIPGGRAEAPVIGSAPELPGGTLINGRIDRLVVTDEEILIVDFKTDQPAPKQASDVSEAYLAQMGAYYCVLREAYPGRNITAALLWTDGPKLMHLPAKSMLAALKKARGGLT